AFADAPDAPLVLGAPEVLLSAACDVPNTVEAEMDRWTSGGYRVLLFGRGRGVGTMEGEVPMLPADLEILGLVALSDELREGVENTIKSFTDLGISLKVISGDNPDTVLALAKQAGIPDAS